MKKGLMCFVCLSLFLGSSIGTCQAGFGSLQAATTNSWQESYSKSDLEKAHRLRHHYGVIQFDLMQESLLQARILYHKIAESPATAIDIRREAAYYRAVCDARLNFQSSDAVQSFRAFLRAYDNGDSTFVPEALFGLGLAYRGDRQYILAGKTLRELIDRFPEHPLADSAKKELQDMKNWGMMGGAAGGPTIDYFNELVEK